MSSTTETASEASLLDADALVDGPDRRQGFWSSGFSGPRIIVHHMMHYDAVMRTTVDIDADLHAESLKKAAQERISMSALVNEALRRILRPVPPVERDPVTGFGVISIGRPVTSAEVADVIDD